MPAACAVCEHNAPMQCAGCHAVRYCSKEHQKSHWKGHKAVCSGLQTLQKSKKGFYKKVNTKGSGATAPANSTVFCNYVLKLPNGKLIDESKGKPFSFKLGCGEVIRGWDEALATMAAGEKARLFVAPEYGYGVSGAGGVIPGNSYLIFDIELIEFEVAEPAKAMKVLAEHEKPLEELKASGLGFLKVIKKEGDGKKPSPGQEVSCHYTGWLTNGTQFDSSIPKGRQFKFTLGQGRVIRAWDEGIGTMKIGEKALLYATPEYAYGSRGAGGVIPPNAFLVFEVELLGAK